MAKIARPDELDFDLVSRSLGSSADPDKRAREVQESFAADINDLYDEVLKTLTTDAQRAILDREIQRYKALFIRKYSAFLRSKSSTLGPLFAEWRVPARASIRVPTDDHHQ
jgi:hypothetical protein